MSNDSNAARQSTPFRIPSLDGIRAFAFVIVFLAHAGLSKWIPGYFGLSVFFFLSGYLITTLLRREYDRSGGIDLKQFYFRRALRILPPFYIILGLAIVLTRAGILPGPPDLRGAIYEGLHLTNLYVLQHGWWDGIPPGTWVFWSLAVEEHFYLVFPLLYLWLRRRFPEPRQQALALAGICGVVLAWRCLLVFGLGAPKDRTYIATDARIDSILFGCILAIYGNPMLDRREPKPEARRNDWLWLAFGVMMLLVSVVIRNPAFEQTWRYTLQGIGLIPVFIAVIRYPETPLFRVLNVSWVRFVGTVSYSLYLLHTAVLFGLEERFHVHGLIKGVAAFAISMGIAVLMYLLVEKQLAALRARSHAGSASRRTASREADGQVRIAASEAAS